MISAVSRVALVVRVKSTRAPASAKRRSAKSTTARISPMFDRGSPPKKTMVYFGLPGDSASIISIALVAVSRLMRRPFAGALRSSL